MRFAASRPSVASLVPTAWMAVAAAAAIAVFAPSMWAGAPARADDACAFAESPPGTVGPAAFAGSVFCLLNQERSSHGLASLRQDSRLARAANGHTASMRSGGYFSHDEPNGSTFLSRIRATGYIKGARRWLVGENLAWGTSELGTPGALVDAWMDSPPHRANILESRFREIGLGVEWGTPADPGIQDGAIVTTDFGMAKRPGGGKR
jgi:uncharacterized protein YkwD